LYPYSREKLWPVAPQPALQFLLQLRRVAPLPSTVESKPLPLKAQIA
jgi:hypothetical protein